MLRNVGSTWVITVAGIAATYVLTPFVIDRLGTEGYGTWTLITSITGYISLLALGVPMACVRYLAQHVAAGNQREVNRTIGSCAALYLVIGGVALIAGAALLLLFGRYEIPPAFADQAPLAFGVMVLQVSLGFIGLLPEGIMFAHHDFVARNAVRLAGVALRFALTIALLTVTGSLLALAAIQLLCLLFDVAVSLALIRRRYPGVRIALADFDTGAVRRVLSFSVYVLLLSAGARLAFETDALVIGAIFGVAAIPFYAVANSLVIYLMELVIAIAAVVSPMATKLNTEGRIDELRQMFLTWSKIALSLSLAACVFLTVLGPRFIGWWIGPAFEEPSGRILQILVLSCLVFLPVRGVALPIMMGLGKPQVPTVAFLATGVLNLVLSIALARPLGLAGVAIGTAVPNVLFAAFVLVVTCRELGVPVRTYLEYVVPRATVGALPMLALLLWFKVGLDVHSMPGMMAAGAAMLVLFGVTWIFFVYRDDRYVDLRPHLGRLRAWSRA
jgi:O-antigen/teichoic acid export membrane protein